MREIRPENFEAPRLPALPPLQGGRARELWWESAELPQLVSAAEAAARGLWMRWPGCLAGSAFGRLFRS